MATTTATEIAAYMPWTTFMNTLEELTQHMPNRIDKSVFAGQSGGTQSQLINGYRFLGLINADGKPQPSLLAIAVKDAAAQKAALKKVIEQKYAPLFALDLTKTTPKEFSERVLESYQNTGDSARKAMRFFLSAVEYLGIPVTALLAKDKAPRPTTSAGSSSPRRRRSNGRRVNEQETPSLVVTSQQAGGTARSIKLSSGGTLTISATLDLFSLNPADRTFVFGLIDKLDEYEKQNPSTDDEDE